MHEPVVKLFIGVTAKNMPPISRYFLEDFCEISLFLGQATQSLRKVSTCVVPGSMSALAVSLRYAFSRNVSLIVGFPEWHVSHARTRRSSEELPRVHQAQCASLQLQSVTTTANARV